MPTIKVPNYTAGQFSPTQWATAAEKARCLKALCSWIVEGMPQKRFISTNKPLYHMLYQHMGHMAHYDRWGFYDAWFSNPVHQLDFLQYHARQAVYGSPEHTWSDAELAFKEWVLSSGILSIYRDKAAEYTMRMDVATAQHALANLPEEARQKIIEQFSG